MQFSSLLTNGKEINENVEPKFLDGTLKREMKEANEC